MSRVVWCLIGPFLFETGLCSDLHAQDSQSSATRSSVSLEQAEHRLGMLNGLINGMMNGTLEVRLDLSDPAFAWLLADSSILEDPLVFQILVEEVVASPSAPRS